jgi:hypothetical protein
MNSKNLVECIIIILILLTSYSAGESEEDSLKFQMQGMIAPCFSTRYEKILLRIHGFSVWPIRKICLFNLFINYLIKEVEEFVKYIFFSLTPVEIKLNTMFDIIRSILYTNLKILMLSLYFIISIAFNIIHNILDVLDFIFYTVFARFFLVNNYTPRLMNELYIDSLVINNVEYNKLLLLWFISILITIILTNRLKVTSAYSE